MLNDHEKFQNDAHSISIDNILKSSIRAQS